MSCILASGYSIPCRAISGIQKVYIGTWNGTSLTYTQDADGTIGTFSGATVSFYGFNQTIETSSFTFPAEINNENNAIAYTQTCAITIQGMSQALSNTIKILGQGVWRIILLDKMGNYWLMGYSGPVQVSALDGGLGKASTDLNGATITFTSKEVQPIYAVTAAAAATVISG